MGFKSVYNSIFFCPASLFLKNQAEECLLSDRTKHSALTTNRGLLQVWLNYFYVADVHHGICLSLFGFGAAKSTPEQQYLIR